jgi:hypothetical protein
LQPSGQNCTSYFSTTETVTGLHTLKQALFLQDSAAAAAAAYKAAITHHKLADLHIEVLKHPACSPDLAPSYCSPIPNLKGRKFSSIAGVMLG